MKHSWEEKLDEQGRRIVELSARLHRIVPPASLDISQLGRWIEEQKVVFSSFSDLEQKRKVKLKPEFIYLYHCAHPEIDLPEDMFRLLFQREVFPLLRADELELTQRIALELEADQNKRIRTYEAVAGGLVLLRAMLSGGLKKQLGTKFPSEQQFLVAIAQNLEWFAEALRGEVKEPPGRVNVKLAALADAVLAHQRESLTQVELYEVLKAMGAQLPDDPEAFRLWLHRARKQGLVKNFRSTRRNPKHSSGRNQPTKATQLKSPI